MPVNRRRRRRYGRRRWRSINHPEAFCVGCIIFYVHSHAPVIIVFYRQTLLRNFPSVRVCVCVWRPYNRHYPPTRPVSNGPPLSRVILYDIITYDIIFNPQSAPAAPVAASPCKLTILLLLPRANTFNARVTLSRRHCCCCCYHYYSSRLETASRFPTRAPP